jgi:hypothetical protein
VYFQNELKSDYHKKTFKISGHGKHLYIMGIGSKTDLLPKNEKIINYSFRAIVTNLKTIIVMKKSKFTEAHILYALKQTETGT